jgi:hypothetical protein
VRFSQLEYVLMSCNSAESRGAMTKYFTQSIQEIQPAQLLFIINIDLKCILLSH